MSTSSECAVSSCPICLGTYDSAKSRPIVYSCGHSVCKSCDTNPTNGVIKCPTCRAPITTRAENHSFIESLDDVRDIEDVRNPDFNYLCSNCEEKTLGKDMHICLTCILDDGELRLEKLSKEARPDEVFDLSMCSNCIVPSHCYHGHKIVPMFPLLMTRTFSSHSSKFDSKLDQFEVLRKSLKLSFASFKIASKKIPETFYLVFNMARKSKTEEVQNEMIDKIEEFIDKCVSIHVEAENEVKQHSIDVQSSSSSTSEPPVFHSKLDQIEHSRNVLKQKVKPLRSSDDVFKNCNRLIELAERSELEEEQDKIIEELTGFLDKTNEFYEKIKSMLNDGTDEMNKRLTQIKTWSLSQVEDGLADWEQIQLEPLVESDDDVEEEDEDDEDDDVAPGDAPGAALARIHAMMNDRRRLEVFRPIPQELRNALRVLEERPMDRAMAEVLYNGFINNYFPNGGF